MTIPSMSPNLSGLLQNFGTGAGEGGKLDLSAKGMIDLAQKGMQAGEAFNESLSGLLSQKNMPIGGLPQIVPKALAQTQNGVAGVQKIGKHFLDTVHSSLVSAQKEQEKIITGESTNIQQSIISIHEANAFLSIFINFATKCQEFYRAVMQTQV